MSAKAHVLLRPELMEPTAKEPAPPKIETCREVYRWTPENFAREQIRGLVRRVFFANGDRPVRQVVLSAAEPYLDVAPICDRVARSLASETRGHVAILARGEEAVEEECPRPGAVRTDSIKARSRQLAVNLWQVPRSGFGEGGEAAGTGLGWIDCLAGLRNEFAYAVIEGPAAGISSEAALVGQLADGIILVLGAHSTRKVAALRIKESLEAADARILGTVLSERTFPVPERIYRHL